MHLEQNQRLVISVTVPASPRSSQSLADWTGVYDGLTEDEVEAIDGISRHKPISPAACRSPCTRHFSTRTFCRKFSRPKNQQVLRVAQRYLEQHQRFAFSAITLYENPPWAPRLTPPRALNAFLTLVSKSDVAPVSLPVLHRAADLWADAGKGGYPRNDADLIVAATALESGRILRRATVHISPGFRDCRWPTGGRRLLDPAAASWNRPQLDNLVVRLAAANSSAWRMSSSSISGYSARNCSRSGYVASAPARAAPSAACPRMHGWPFRNPRIGRDSLNVVITRTPRFIDSLCPILPPFGWFGRADRRPERQFRRL